MTKRKRKELFRLNYFSEEMVCGCWLLFRVHCWLNLRDFDMQVHCLLGKNRTINTCWC